MVLWTLLFPQGPACHISPPMSCSTRHNFTNSNCLADLCLDVVGNVFLDEELDSHAILILEDRLMQKIMDRLSIALSSVKERVNTMLIA